MINTRDLMDLLNSSSLARAPFKGDFDLSECAWPGLAIPNRFKEKSFFPSNGLDLNSFTHRVYEDLLDKNVDQEKARKIIPGLCEAVKNAYEHGNSLDNSKEIYFAQAILRDSVEFLVGDSGRIIKADFIPYVLLFRQKGNKKFNENIPGFYDFIGEMYAPIGHSGVGTKTMNISFSNIKYFKRDPKGLIVYLRKNL